LIDDGKYPVYGANGVIGRYNSYNHDSPEVLLTCRGATCGRINISQPFSWINGNAMVIHRKSDVLSFDFLKYIMSSLDYSLIITGAAQPQITRQKLAPTVISYPSLSEQKSIVSELDRINELISLKKAQLNDLDALAQSIFYEMFGDPVVNEKNWKVKKLGEISTLISNGNTPKGGSDVYVEKGYLFLRSQNVWKNRLELDDVAFIDAQTHTKLKKSILMHNDLLITKTGRINTENSSLGRTALFEGEDGSANINGHVYLARLKKGMMHKFVLYILISNAYRELIRKTCVGGIDKRQLNRNHIEDFPIIFPPIDL
jgi:type I restriction enzyme S subunit